jgi:hypothetical protein
MYYFDESVSVNTMEFSKRTELISHKLKILRDLLIK